MFAKEVIEARWKLVAGILLAVAVALIVPASYEFSRTILGSLNTSILPPGITNKIDEAMASYNSFTWYQWFARFGSEIVVLFGALLGGSLVAGEVGKGTIFFLLSKPLSRRRILLTKYAIAGGMLLAIIVVGTFVMYMTTLAGDHPQPLGGMLLSMLLLWLGGLSMVGLALLLSVMTSDVLRAVALTILIGTLIGLPGYFPQAQGWSLPGYWASLPAYTGTTFPAAEFSLVIVFAALPLAAALALFNKRAY